MFKTKNNLQLHHIMIIKRSMLMVCMESVKEQASGAVNSNNLIYPYLNSL